jgi:hypothetical protein
MLATAAVIMTEVLAVVVLALLVFFVSLVIFTVTMQFVEWSSEKLSKAIINYLGYRNI